MSLRALTMILCCLGVPPPQAVHAQSINTGAPWDHTTAPYLLQGELVHAPPSQAVTRPLVLQPYGGLAVDGGTHARIDGPISGGDPLFPASLYKLGGGRLDLNTANDFYGTLWLMQGSVRVNHDGALGQPGGWSSGLLSMGEGTRLEYTDGVNIEQRVQIQPLDPRYMVPPTWTVPTVHSPDPGAAVLRVASGMATQWGELTALAPVIKDGAGTLRIAGMADMTWNTATVREGGLRVDGSWWGDMQTLPGTVLSGTGTIGGRMDIAGALHPGAPGRVGTLSFASPLDHVHLTPNAVTRIRIDAQGRADRIDIAGTAHVDGRLTVQAAPGQWDTRSRWTIVQADGGLDAGRYAQASTNIAYLEPVLTYESTQIVLGMRYTPVALNSLDASWQGTVLEDGRLPRETAIAHAGSGRVWARTWVTTTTREGRDTLPGDERDVSGVQIGVDKALSPDWSLAAFAGMQYADYSTRTGADSGLHSGSVKDSAGHLGLGLSRRIDDWRIGLGVAHAKHHARAQRHASPGEAALDSRPTARLTQLWLHGDLQRPWRLGGWGIAPYGEIAALFLHRDSVTESGGPTATTLSSMHTTQTQSHFGVRVQRAWPTPHGPAHLSIRIGWRRLWNHDTLYSAQSYRDDVQGTIYDIAGLPSARDTLRLDVGVDAPIARRTRLGLAYTGDHGGGRMQHGAWLNVAVVY